MSYSPTYATITVIEIQKLAELKAGGSVWAVATALNAYAQGKTSCFPSIPTIIEFLGGSYGKRAIHRALKFLEDHELIKRNGRSSKKRFILKLRALAYQGVEAVKRKGHICRSAYRDESDAGKELEKNRAEQK